MRTPIIKKSLLYLSLLSLLFVASCQPDKILSGDCSLHSFSFSTDNAGIVSTEVGRITLASNGNLVFITVPEGCDLTTLKPDFTVQEKAHVTLNGSEIVSGNTPVNFSDIVKLTVTAENGNSTTYNIVAKKGISRVDNLIYDFMNKYSIPGISVSVMINENMSYSAGLGFADVEKNTRVTPNHLFRLASVSKQFTSICIMTLVEEGKLDLDKNIFGEGGILGDDYTKVTGAKAEVSCRHFLQHNSGWISDPIDPMFSSSTKGKSLDELIEYMLAQNHSTYPGKTYSYYNLGFGVLGRVIEKITGVSYETYLREVMAKAGITDVHVGKGLAGRRANECVYYSQEGTNGYGNDMDVIAAAGGVIASTAEMMKLMAHIDGKGGVADILKPETRAEMIKPSDNYARYALGWRRGHNFFPDGYYHSGNLAGTATIWCGGVNDRLSAAILCNSRSYISGFDDDLFYLLRDVINNF